MKRFVIIFYSALAIFMASCTKDIVTTDSRQSMSDADAWLTDLTLPVPIMLGEGAGVTRTAISDLADMHEKRFGIFAIDRDSPTVNALLFDEDAYFIYDGQSGAGRFRFGNLAAQENIMYYPTDSKCNYSFYSYYKKGECTVEVEHSGTDILVELGLYDNEDVLWGKAESPEIDGYNARYIRKNPGIPVAFEFKHPAAGLSFSVSPSDDMLLSGGQSYIVEQLTFCNVITKAMLCLADCSKSGTKEGTFLYGTQMTKYVRLASENMSVDLTKTASSDSHLALGHEVFIAPQNESIRCFLTVRCPDGETFDVPFDLHPSMVKPSLSGYQAGKMYGYNIVIGLQNGTPSVEEIRAGGNGKR